MYARHVKSGQEMLASYLVQVPLSLYSSGFCLFYCILFLSSTHTWFKDSISSTRFIMKYGWSLPPACLSRLTLPSHLRPPEKSLSIHLACSSGIYLAISKLELLKQ